MTAATRSGAAPMMIDWVEVSAMGGGYPAIDRTAPLHPPAGCPTTRAGNLPGRPAGAGG
ncbi:hypothetical protein GCM10022379_32280 [Micromonospora maritima]